MRRKEEIREEILDAAWKRFAHFGYNSRSVDFTRLLTLECYGGLRK